MNCVEGTFEMAANAFFYKNSVNTLRHINERDYKNAQTGRLLNNSSKLQELNE